MRKIILFSLLFSLLVTGCSSSGGEGNSFEVNDSVSNGVINNSGFGSYDDYESDNGLDYDEDYDNSTSSESDGIDAEMTLSEEKLVYKCDISIETKTYKESYKLLKDFINEYNVVIESEYQTDSAYNWYYDDYTDSASLSTEIVCRVPSEKYNDFIEELSNLGVDTKVTSKNTEVMNITQTYYDSKAELESLEVQEARLLVLLESAETLDDMLTIESRLQDVRYRINSLMTDLSYMDMAVAYSYVTINLEEVRELTTYDDEKTFFERVIDDFDDAWEESVEMLEELIGMIFRLIPFILFIFIPCVLVLKLLILIFKKITGFNLKKNTSKTNSFKFKPFSLRPKKKILHDDSNDKNE